MSATPSRKWMFIAVAIFVVILLLVGTVMLFDIKLLGRDSSSLPKTQPTVTTDQHIVEKLFVGEVSTHIEEYASDLKEEVDDAASRIQQEAKEQGEPISRDALRSAKEQTIAQIDEVLQRAKQAKKASVVRAIDHSSTEVNAETSNSGDRIKSPAPTTATQFRARLNRWSSNLIGSASLMAFASLSAIVLFLVWIQQSKNQKDAQLTENILDEQ